MKFFLIFELRNIGMEFISRHCLELQNYDAFAKNGGGLSFNIQLVCPSLILI